MFRVFLLSFAAGIILVGCRPAVIEATSGSSTLPVPGGKDGALIVDHRSTRLSEIPLSAIKKACETLVVAYGHTSHGSQLVDGLSSLQKAKGNAYRVSVNSQEGLRLMDSPFQGASDLGNPDRTAWSEATRRFLGQHPEVNVVMWSWCGQCATPNPQDIDTYLGLMDKLEQSFPKVKFVYMTGHLDGTGSRGATHQRNEQIRSFCRANGKVLYDFADIERYDPDGNDFLDRGANDNCDYQGGNWAIEWARRNPGKVFACNPAHSQPLNGNLKAYAAWHLFARLAGWQGA